MPKVGNEMCRYSRQWYESNVMGRKTWVYNFYILEGGVQDNPNYGRQITSISHEMLNIHNIRASSTITR